MRFGQKEIKNHFVSRLFVVLVFPVLTGKNSPVENSDFPAHCTPPVQGSRDVFQA